MKIGIVGCAGRMGRMLIETVLETEGCALGGGAEAPGSDALGQDLGSLAGVSATGITVTEDSLALFEACGVVIDFTVPAATAAHAALARQTGTALVVGTTGLDESQQAALVRAAEKTAVVQAANMSVGVNLLLGLTGQVASILGPDYDIEVVEMHHRHKVDAPSGTALALGEAAAAGRGVNLDEVALRGRDGHTGPRKKGGIGFATLRGGDVVGDHTVIFAAEGERLELTHKASSRAVFARGAVRAALWTQGVGTQGSDGQGSDGQGSDGQGVAPGFYSMRDVLGFS